MAKSKGANVPGLIFGLLGIGVIVGGIWAKLHQLNIEENGEPGRAFVSDKWEDYDDEDGTSYWIAYEFETRAGQRLEGETSLKEDVWRDLVAGRSDIGVLYLPGDPSTHAIEGSWDDLFFYIMCAIGLLFAAFGGAMTYSALRK